jgi:restriction endonuclease S subunit
MYKYKLELNQENQDDRKVAKQSYLEKAKKVKVKKEEMKSNLPPGWSVLPITSALNVRDETNSSTLKVGMGKLVSNWVSNGIVDENDIDEEPYDDSDDCNFSENLSEDRIND